MKYIVAISLLVLLVGLGFMALVEGGQETRDMRVLIDRLKRSKAVTERIEPLVRAVDVLERNYRRYLESKSEEQRQTTAENVKGMRSAAQRLLSVSNEPSGANDDIRMLTSQILSRADLMTQVLEAGGNKRWDEVTRLVSSTTSTNLTALTSMRAKSERSIWHALIASPVTRMVKDQSTMQYGVAAILATSLTLLALLTWLYVSEKRLHRAAQSALRESEELFRGGFDVDAIGKAILSLDGGFRRVNRSLCESLVQVSRFLRVAT